MFQERSRALVKSTARRLGFEISRGRYSAAARRAHLFRELGVQTVIDVGANVGQYGCRLRESGYSGRILSFEPNPAAYQQLRHCLDAEWDAYNVALGASEDLGVLNVAEASDCSSLLAPTSAMKGSYPSSRPVGEVTVPIHTLDSYMGITSGGDGVFLKIDTQGFEKEVLSGAGGTIDRVVGIEIEMALIPTYEGGSTVYDLLPQLYSMGFQAVSTSNGFTDPASLQTLDIDVLLRRR